MAGSAGTRRVLANARARGPPMPTIARRQFLEQVAAAGLLAGSALRAAPRRRPNIIFMMTDDQRWDTLSCAGNPYLQTPFLDRLATEGARFDNMFVTNALCGPSRATALTGLYSHTHGVRRNEQEGGLSTERVTFLELLQRAGYRTGFIGKWHNAGFGRNRGYDYYFGFRGQGVYNNPRIAENGGADEPRTGWMDDLLTDKAIDFVRGQRAETPFALCLWFKSPHRSWVPAPRYERLLADTRFTPPKTFETDYAGKPAAVREADMKIGDFEDVRDLDTFLRGYYRCLAGIDDNVGRLLACLDEIGAAEDTCVLFTGDNGFFLGEWHFFDKRMMYEPSIRVPLLMRYPRQIEPLTRVRPQAVNVDLAPTILDLCGVASPVPQQGHSLAPLARGEAPPDWRRDWLYEYYEFPGVHSVRQHRGVRTERYKYIHWFQEPEEFELYDLEADPLEEHNLHGRREYRALAADLRARLAELRRETDDPDLG